MALTQKEKDKKRAGARTRNWSIIAYPESMPENWKEILAELQLRILVSPLHESDVNADETQKKPHYHILLQFDSVKRLEQVQEISDMLNAPRPMMIDSYVGAARYLIHQDNPEKAQYEACEVLEFGGADFLSAAGRISDKYQLIAEMMDWCDEQGQFSFAALMRYARQNNQEWFRALCDNCGWAVKEYLKSATWEIKEENYRASRTSLMKDSLE